MSYTDTLLDDFSRRDNLQVVSLIQSSSPSTPIENIDALNQSISWKMAAMGGSLGIEATDQVWLLGCKSLGDVVPQRGDTIETADGTLWTIVLVTQKSMKDVPIYYEAVGRKQN